MLNFLKPKLKSEVLLKSFVKYCHDHPEERFWQALRNWCGWAFIYASNDSLYDGKKPDLNDTFYWEQTANPNYDPDITTN